MAAAAGHHALRGEGDELVEQLAVGVALLARGEGLADQLEEAAADARADADGHHEVLVLHDQLKEATHRQCSRGEDNEDERPDGEGRTGRELLSPVAEPLRLGRDQRADSLLEEPARPEPALVCDEARRGEEEVGPELQRDAQLGGRDIAGVIAVRGGAELQCPAPLRAGAGWEAQVAAADPSLDRHTRVGGHEPGESGPARRTSELWRQQNGHS